MLEQLVQSLVVSKNEAADDLLLEALSLGTDPEQMVALGALLRRQTTRGLGGVLERYDKLSESLKRGVLSNLKTFHHALRECGRSDNPELRLAAMRLIAIGRQGKLAYVLSENLHDQDESLSKAATDAMVGLARWVSMESHALQRGTITEQSRMVEGTSTDRAAVYRELMENRAEIEAAVARAMDVHRGRHGQELLRAALLLCDWPGSKTLAILTTLKHGGQSPMVRRLQQPPTAEHVEAFLLGASHGQLRSHFGVVFSHIEEAPVLDALLRKTHWLKDHQLQLCVHQVSRGKWWGQTDLQHDIDRRPSGDAVLIAEWLAASGMHDALQDERMEPLRVKAQSDFDARLRLLRLTMSRRRNASTALVKAFLSDPDERLARMAAREIIGRKPADYENSLLQLMTNAPDSVRRVVSRAIGQVGFDQFWQRFDRMDRPTRKQAGKAMLKLLPDALQRLSSRLSSGPVEQRIKAMQIVHELDLAEPLKDALMPLCSFPQARIRSKAVSLLAEIGSVTPDVLLERVLNDSDARVRANAIEVLENKRATEYVPMLTQRARSAQNRERANAIKALGRMRVSTASTQLLHMLQDQRSEHRISALWALRQIGWWNMLNEVGRLAKSDPNMRVRRYALGVIKGVAQLVQEQKAQSAPRELVVERSAG